MTECDGPTPQTHDATPRGRAATPHRGAAVLALACLFGLAVSCREKQIPLQPTAPVIRQVDHVLVTSDKADALYSLFTDTFQCPVAWPMADYGGFQSGGVALGNVNLEIMRATGAADGGPQARFTGMALEPEPLDACLSALEARGIPFGRPAPHRSSLFRLLWTTVALPGVSSETANVFLCEYGSNLGRELPERRRRAREDLRSRDGGPLTLDSVAEVVLGAKDPVRTTANWQELFNPAQPTSPGLWSLGAGPAIRVGPAAQDHDSIQALVLQVHSLEQARTFLHNRGLIGIDEPGRLSISGPSIDGLTIIVVAADRSASAPASGGQDRGK